jgi:hypothetical protein
VNAAERVRAYLQTRTAYYAEIRADVPAEVASIHDWETGKDVPLREADLEALLQTLELLASSPEDPLSREYVLNKAARQVEGDYLSRPALAQCNRCGRFTWAPSEVNQTDQMTQPSGQPCGGYMEALK